MASLKNKYFLRLYHHKTTDKLTCHKRDISQLKFVHVFVALNYVIIIIIIMSSCVLSRDTHVLKNMHTENISK